MDNTSSNTIEISYKEKSSVFYNFIKRLADIILSLVAVVLFSPIFLIVALVIRIDSKGKVIFGHERIGKNMKRIKVYKFRTMYENSNEIFNNFSEEQKREYYINFKLDNDPRITRVGAFLRKTSLDELPQLINILKGDMSIVGPRPVILEEVDLIELRKSYNIDKILPGITGWAQINGRDNIGNKEKVKYDYEYLVNKSFIMDLYIIVMTALKVLKRSDIKD